MTPSDNTGGDSPEMSADGESLAQQNGSVLRKGPWTKEEDEILVKFVQEKGIVKWSSIGKQTGLARSGKSCRLRWLNHLRPNLKKGSFTNEEVNLIVNLHSEYGNKWTRIASKLPGRTDNEIKNFWNTRVKKCQKRQLPLYPETIEEDRSNVVNANYDYNPRFFIDNLDKKFTARTDFDQIFQSSANAPSETSVLSLHQLSSISPHSWSLQQLTSPVYLPPQSFQSSSFDSSSKQHPLSQTLSTGNHFPLENRSIPTPQSTHFFLQQSPSSPSLQQSKTSYLSMQALLSSSTMPPPIWLSSVPEDNGSLLTQQCSISHSTHPLIKPSTCASTPHQYSLMLSLNDKQSSYKRPGGRLPRPLSAPLITSTPTSKKPFCSTLELNSSSYLSTETPLNINSTTRTSTSPTYQLNFPTVGLSGSSLQDSPLSVDLTWPSNFRSMNEPISPSSSFISKMERPSIQSISAAAVKYPSDTSLSQLNAQSMASFNLSGTQLQEEELATGGGQSSRKDNFFGQNLTRESFLTECMKAEDSLDNILSKENVPNEMSPTEFLLNKYSIKDGILTQSFETMESSDSSLNTENASYKSRRRKEFMNISRENNGLHTQVTKKVDILNETSKPTFLQDGSSRNDTTVSEKSEGVLGEESLKREVNKATLMEGSKNCDILVEDTREKDIVDTGSKVGLSSEQYKFTKCLNMEDSLLVQGFNVGGEFIEELRKDRLEERSREGQLIESSSKDEFVIGESSFMGDQLIKIMEQHDVTDASMNKDICTPKVNSGKEFLLTSNEQYPVADKANQVSNQRHTSLLLESGGRDINSCSIKHSAEHIEAEDHIDPEISSILDYFPMTAEIPEWYNTSQEISNSKTAF